MQSDLAIKTEGLGKCYRIGEATDLTLSLREALVRGVQRFSAGLWPRGIGSAPDTISGDGAETEFWALRDLDLEIRVGEVLGIVGRNGAGKSTLLKVLSRITAPTNGHAEIRGRVGSLLEVGTGFHLELTGRENIYLNGAILGMKKAEIEANFHEIVDFSEIDRFLDTPVKRYSSGMRMRLGFSVAAFLDPEVLFIDEVLAVGDAAFRKKCMGKMGAIAGEGRTILFVSHNMAAIANLCTRAILIEEGRCVASGEPNEVIQLHLNQCESDSSSTALGVFDLEKRKNSYGNRELIIRALELLDREFKPRGVFIMGEKMYVRIRVKGLSAHRGAAISVILRDAQDQWIADLNTWMSCRSIKEPRQHAEIATLEIDRLPLVPGTYYLSVSVAHGRSTGNVRIDYVDRAARFEVTEGDVYGSGHPMTGARGVLYLEGGWSIEGDGTDEDESVGDS